MKILSLKLRLIFSFLTIAMAIWVAFGIISWIETKKRVDDFFDTFQILLAKQLSTVDWSHINQNIEKKVYLNVEDFFDDIEDDKSIGFTIFNEHSQIVFSEDDYSQDFQYIENFSGFSNQKIHDNIWRIFLLKSFDEKHTIAIGQSLKFRYYTAFQIIIKTLIPWGIYLFVLAVIGIFLLERELKPIKKIRKEILLRTPNDLTPLKTNRLPMEVKPLVEAMNTLFLRIKGMFERERSFISDAAHELRSPLAALRVQLDVAILSDDDKEAQNRAMDNMCKGLKHLTRLVDQLLTLSKIETGSFYETHNEKKRNWAKVVKKIVSESQSAAHERNIFIKVVPLEKTAVIREKVVLWSLVLRNLLDNAIKYSPKNSEILIEFGPDELRIKNKNKNKNLSKEDVKNLGQRFFRPPGSEPSGSGLGLSIAKKVADIYNCSISFELINNEFIVTIRRL